MGEREQLAEVREALDVCERLLRNTNSLHAQVLLAQLQTCRARLTVRVTEVQLAIMQHTRLAHAAARKLRLAERTKEHTT